MRAIHLYLSLAAENNSENLNYWNAISIGEKNKDVYLQNTNRRTISA